MGRRQCDSDEEGTFGRQVAIDSRSRLDVMARQNHLIGQFQTGSRILAAGQAPLARRRSGEFSNTPRESQSEHCQRTATASRHDWRVLNLMIVVLFSVPSTKSVTIPTRFATFAIRAETTRAWPLLALRNSRSLSARSTALVN